jgi:hypothetical protein
MRLAVLAAAAAALLAPEAATALSPGSFAPTGSMTSVRNGPAAAPLSDGRVLVAGGRTNTSFLQTADLYDPAGGSFSATGTMAALRFSSVAAPLTDGLALVAGGFSGATYLQSAELYDPATGNFSPTGPMGVPRIAAAAAPLPDGRVLVVGGFYNDGGGDHYQNSAEIYDPGTAGWSPTGSMSVPRFAPAVAPLPDGKVLVAGGYYYDGANHYLDTAEIYDPAAGSFSPTGALPEKLEAAAASPLPDGRVLVAGGITSDGVTVEQSAVLYDPSTGTFSPGASMTSKRYAAAAAPLPDGRVLVAGGHDATTRLQSAELFSLPPRSPYTFNLRGKSLVFNAPAAGTVTVSDASAKSTTSAMVAKKKKKGLSLKSSSVSGGPGAITVALKLTGKAKQRFKATGKVKVKVKISFAPRAECLTRFFKSCYDSGTDTAKLKIKKKAKKKK